MITDIISVEKFLKPDIEAFFLSVYPDGHLISHGLDHHRRVWNHAIEIILNTRSNQLNINRHFIEQLMIACYLHDIGMATDYGINHGVVSRRKAIEFLKSVGKNLSEFNLALDAIENHDDKEYPRPSVENIILIILSAADDMDAFGFTGIYRYTDIYLRRKVKNSDIGLLVRKNASGRFNNLNTNLKLSLSLLKRHSKRYITLDIFFKKYNQEFNHYTFGTLSPSGYCGVIEIIGSCLNSENINDFPTILLKYSKDPVINWFHNGFLSEMGKKKQ